MLTVVSGLRALTLASLTLTGLPGDGEAGFAESAAVAATAIGSVGSRDPTRTAATTAAVLGRDRRQAALLFIMDMFLR
ncbi:hypothetical protein KNE206_41320 [Kitasatospora sp. NE20-6]